MARDPYKYFRIEARELLDGLAAGALELEKRASVEVVGRLLRLAHTLKGASRVVRQPEMADAAHRIEDVLAPHRPEGAVPPEGTGEILRLVDDIGERLKVLGEAPVAPPAAPAISAASVEVAAPRPPEPAPVQIAETVRIAIADMDALLEGISEAGVHAGALERIGAEITALRVRAADVERELALARASAAAGRPVLARLESVGRTAGQLGDALDQAREHLLEGTLGLGRELRQLRDEAGSLRLVPADTLFAPLARAVRDAAQVLERRVTWETSGGDVRLDAHVLAAVRDALLHVVRNAVAHGIEPAAERAAAGKPAEGLIHLRVERRGGRAAFVCRDDGRGLDLEAVTRVARERGLLPRDAGVPPAPEVVSRLIFEPGLSTSGMLTEIAGRGIGLDVVRDVAARFKGEARAHSQPGRGTTIELVVPITLSSVAALAVDAGGRTSWIPLSSVAKTMRVTPTEIARVQGGTSIRYEEAAHAFAPLAAVLETRASEPRAPGAWTTVLVKSGERTAAVGVDRLLGVSRIVVRPLPSAAGDYPALAGATFDVFGDPQLVLDAGGLADAVSARAAEAEADVRPARPSVLVIDDSLTTRMLEQSILEAAGYEVELAISAEEGLEKARARRFGLFLVDVEMPGMNGFEFISSVQADPSLAGIPAILVTSLDSPEDRRRGRDVGAHAYIVKGEFDDGRLRSLIRDLIG